MALREQDGGTAASIVTDMQMSGKAAAMGQGVIRDVAAALTDTFATNLAGLVTAGEPAPAPVAAAATGAAAPAGDGQPAPAAPGPAAPPRPAPAPGPAGGGRPVAGPPDADAGLPVGQVVASVVAGRLQDPRARAALAGLLALLLLRVGIAIGRRR